MDEIEKSDGVEMSNYVDRDRYIEVSERINNLEKEMKNIERIIKNMGNRSQALDVSDLDQRLHNIENHIYRRRNPFMGKGQQKKDS